MTTNLANASIKASGTSQTRTIGDRFAEVFNVKNFGAAYLRPVARCLRFAAMVAHAPRKTRSRPAGYALAAWDFHPSGSLAQFPRFAPPPPGTGLSRRASG